MQLLATTAPTERRAVLAVALALLALGVCACVDGPLDEGLDEARAREVFERLHSRVYAVYDLGLDRDALHAHLAASFDGELLTREYVEHFTTLARMAADDASMRVLRVDYEDVELLEADAEHLRLLADWSVGGIVRHRGHRHVRTNRYRAVYELARRGDGWRMVGTWLRDMRRLGGSLDASEGGNADTPRSRRGMMSPLDLLRAGLAEELPDEQPGTASDAASDPAP